METGKINDAVENLLNMDMVLLKNNVNSAYINKYVDADYLVMSLKQLLHVIKSFTDTIKGPYNIILVVKTKNQKFFIESALKKLKILKRMKVVSALREIKDHAGPKIIILSDGTHFDLVRGFVRNMCLNDTFLFFSLNNPKNPLKDMGTYKIRCEVDSMNKILFLLVLLFRIV